MEHPNRCARSHGEMRHLWLEFGGKCGRLGYPVSDGMPTSDGRGRRSQFEHGEIQWFGHWCTAQWWRGCAQDVAKESVVSGATEGDAHEDARREGGGEERATKAPAKRRYATRRWDEDPTKKATAKKTPTKTSASESVSEAVVKERAGLSRRKERGY